jgi:hypothetical protein
MIVHGPPSLTFSANLVLKVIVIQLIMWSNGGGGGGGVDDIMGQTKISSNDARMNKPRSPHINKKKKKTKKRKEYRPYNLHHI